MRGGTTAYNQMMGASPGRGGISPMPNITSPNIDGRQQMSAGGASGISPNHLVSPSVHGRYNQGVTPAYNPISPSYQGNPRSAMLGATPGSGVNQQPTPLKPGETYCPLSPAYNPSKTKKE